MWKHMSKQKVQTNFTTGKQAKLTVRPKHTGMQLVIPGALNSKDPRKRMYLTFPTSEPFGISPDFGKFVQVSLQVVVNKWRTKKAAQKWVTTQRRW